MCRPPGCAVVHASFLHNAINASQNAFYKAVEGSRLEHGAALAAAQASVAALEHENRDLRSKLLEQLQRSSRQQQVRACSRPLHHRTRAVQCCIVAVGTGYVGGTLCRGRMSPLLSECARFTAADCRRCQWQRRRPLGAANPCRASTSAHSRATSAQREAAGNRSQECAATTSFSKLRLFLFPRIPLLYRTKRES